MCFRSRFLLVVVSYLRCRDGETAQSWCASVEALMLFCVACGVVTCVAVEIVDLKSSVTKFIPTRGGVTNVMSPPS